MTIPAPDCLAQSFAPPSALLVWTDARSIYVQFPRTDPLLPPYIATYPLTTLGLSTALSILRQSEIAGPHSMPPTPTSVRAKVTATPAGRVLRSMGII